MKLNTSERSTVESSGVSGESGFKLKSSKHAFQLLSSGLYTNKIQAVIRELSCNAADAHVLNSNQKTAFDVKLPNRLDSQFYVRRARPRLPAAARQTVPPAKGPLRPAQAPLPMGSMPEAAKSVRAG